MIKKVDVQQYALWQKLQEKRAPLSFEVEITARCNMSCRHCYINLPANDQQAQKQELTAGEILAVAEQAVRLGAFWCLLTGGEPLLRNDFPDIYLGLKRLGLLVSVFTNATLISAEHVGLFKKYPPRDIETTVYGATATTYERVSRNRGSFERFVNGLAMLQDAGLRVRLKAMAIQSNLHEQAAIAAFCRERTKDFFRFDPQLHLRFDGDATRNDEIRAERLTPAQVVALEEADTERRKALRDKCTTLINTEFANSDCDRLFRCGAGTSSFSVGYDGRFRLCSSLWAEGTTCDLKTTPLAEAWTGLVPLVHNLRSQRQEFRETCQRCALINLCLCCPANAHLETGELDGFSPYFCEVAQERAKSIRGEHVETVRQGVQNEWEKQSGTGCEGV